MSLSKKSKKWLAKYGELNCAHCIKDITYPAQCSDPRISQENYKVILRKKIFCEYFEPDNLWD